MDRVTDGSVRMDRWTDRQMDKLMDKQMDGHKHTHTHTQLDFLMNRQTDR